MAQQDGNKIKKLLRQNSYLSPTFVGWYSQIFKEIGISFSDQTIVAQTHPHFLVNHSIDSFKPAKGYVKTKFKKKITDNEINTLVTNSQELIDHFKSVAQDFDNYFVDLPPLTTTSLFLDCGSAPKLIFLKNKSVYIAVKISCFNYVINYYKIKRLIKKFTKFNLGVAEKIGFIRTKFGCYFLSNFLGYDFETEIIERHKKNKRLLYRIACDINNFFYQNRVFFRNVSPRNLINGFNGQVYLIDFDNLISISKKNKMLILNQSLFSQIWFNDILPKNMCQKIAFKPPSIDEKTEVKADTIELCVFEKKYIPFKDRQELFEITNKFEKKDNLGDLNIYGHQLGRFISDFWLEDSEGQLLKFLYHDPSQIKPLRVILYILSRLDQELLLRQKYGLDTKLALLSEKYFIKKQKVGSFGYGEIIKFFQQKKSFSEKYKFATHLI